MISGEPDEKRISLGAQSLAKAWRAGLLLEDLPDNARPHTQAQAYAIQHRLLQELGDQSAGWKVAGASRQAMAAHPMPMFGFLRKSCLHDNGPLMAMPATGVFTLELEIALRFARTVEPADTAFEPEMVDAAFLAFEVVRSRFRDRKAVDRWSLLADDVGFHAFVQGDFLPGALQSELVSSPATVHNGNALCGPPLSGDERVDVRHALQLFWDHAAQHRLTVPAGSVLTTGMVARAVDVHQPGTYEGRLGGLSVRLLVR